jgi:trk system potassium uptake protein TrkA
MKYIVIGLGNFGASLAEKLTEMGHEVIGVDKRMDKIESMKDKITYAICLDSTDRQAVNNLPLTDTDVAIVAIGEDEGPSLLTAALMKQLNIKRIIARTLSPVHTTILQAMGIDEIIKPEEEAAERMAKKLNIKGVVDSFILSERFNIIEANVPGRYIGMSIEQVDFQRKYNVVVLTIIRQKLQKNILGAAYKKQSVLGVVDPATVLEQDDILVIFGDIRNIKAYLES